jgi:hypothetical protein
VISFLSALVFVFGTASTATPFCDTTTTTVATTTLPTTTIASTTTVASTTTIPTTTTLPFVAPTLSLQAVSCSEIDLTWTDPNTNEAGYVVDRHTDQFQDAASGCLNPPCWTRIAVLPPNTTFYRDTGLEPLTTYYYQVYPIRADEIGFSAVWAQGVTCSG